jgi:hypothetical protein
MKLLKYFFAIIMIACTTFAQPKLSINKLESNLGVIFSGMKKQGKIILRNIGNDTLRIFSIQPSCGCTTVRQPKEFLLPGESDEIDVEFNSIGYHGLVRKHINIITNDPTYQNVSVQILVDVKDELRSTNLVPQIWLDNTVVGKTSVQNISFVNVSDHKIKIKGARASSKSLTLQLGKNILKPNDTLNIQVTIKADKAGYYKDDFITIETDSKNLPNVETKIIYNFIEEK